MVITQVCIRVLYNRVCWYSVIVGNTAAHQVCASTINNYQVHLDKFRRLVALASSRFVHMMNGHRA